jgi:hypothetical protein
MDDESTINSPKQKWHDAYYYSPLCTTETIARKNNLSVYNAEMRHAYYLSEETNSKISVQDLMEIDQGSIASCAYVQDISPNLRQWYTATVERYNTNDATRLLKAMAQKNPSCTIADVQKSEQVQQLATKLSLYNWELLNLTMLHDLYRNKNKKIILMYMGADHIDAIEPLLSDFNYKEIARIGSKPLIDEDDPTGGKIIPVVNIEQLPTLLAEHNLFSTSLAADYLIPVYRTITTGQFPLSSFVTVA